VSFVAITWSIAGGFLQLQEGLPALIDVAVRAGVIPDSLVLPRSPPATVDCGAAIERARASATDPEIAAEARVLVWRMGFETGFAGGMVSATIGSNSPFDAAPVLADQPRQIAQVVGVDPPSLPRIEHAANALSEFQAFVAAGSGCIVPQLAERYGPREAALYKYALVAGHSVVYRIHAPQLDPLFVPELRVYGAEAGIPLELSQPFVAGTLDAPPGDGIQQKVQVALARIEEFLKAKR
jgi:hypothetical protein